MDGFITSTPVRPANYQISRNRSLTASTAQDSQDDSVFLSGHVGHLSFHLQTIPEGSGNPQADVSVRKTSHANNMTTNSCAVCRICHGGEFSSPTIVNGQATNEPLISPCYCRGTMGLYHRVCLEKWLSASNTSCCEICKFQYVTTSTPKPFREFLKNPGNMEAKRNLVGDTACYFILTPLALASVWLCLTGAYKYSQMENKSVELPGLVCLAVFLILTYTVWLTVSLRYHYKIWRDWSKKNTVVRICDFDEAIRRSKGKIKSDDNNNSFEAAVTQSPGNLANPQTPSHRQPITPTHYDTPWSPVSMQIWAQTSAIGSPQSFPTTSERGNFPPAVPRESDV